MYTSYGWLVGVSWVASIDSDDVTHKEMNWGRFIVILKTELGISLEEIYAYPIDYLEAILTENRIMTEEAYAKAKEESGQN